MLLPNRLARVAAAVVLVFVLIAVLAVFLAPRLLDSQAAVAAIQKEVSDRTGGAFTLERVQLSLFPLPRLAVLSPRLEKGASVSVRADALIVYPRLLPLLTGDVEIARIRVVSPSAALSPAGGAAAPKDSGPGLSPEAALAALGPALDQLRRRLPDLEAAVTGGSLAVNPAAGPPLRIEGIEASMNTAALRFDLSCRSNLWERLRLRWSADGGRPPGKADITVFQLRPGPIVNRLLPEAGPAVQHARVNLTVAVRPERDGLPIISFSGDLPEAVLERKATQVAVSADAFAGSVQVDRERVQIAVDRWKGGQPSLAAQAHFDFARSGGAALTLKRVRVRADDVDAAAAKAPVLFFGGDDPVLVQVFDVLRGGRVSDLRIDARIPDPQALFQPADFSLGGRIEDGVVHIPGIGLDLTAVAGAARIERGLLTAEALSAVCETVSGSDGALTLSLFDGADRFGLDIRFDAGLTGLPATLARLVDVPSVSKGAEAIRSLTGRAEGRLVLGETLGDIRPRIDIERLSAECSVSPLPGPMTISGSGIHYRGESIRAGALDLSLEGVRISGLSGSLTWEKGLFVEADAAAAALDVDPVMAWLPQAALPADRTPDISLSGGTVQLSDIRWRGPVFSPARWTFDANGIVESVQVDGGRLPGAVRVSRLAFRAKPTALQVRDFQIGFLDAALSGSGSLQGRPQAIERAVVALEGKIGPEADRWLLSQSEIHTVLTLQVHQLSDVRLQWDRGGTTSVSGHLLVNRDTRLSLALETGPGRFDLKRLFIEDPDSRAELSIRRTDDAVSFAYQGRLTKATVDRFVQDNALLGGRIMGGMRGRIDLAVPGQSSAEGRLEIAQLALPWPGGPSLTIEEASLYGETHRLDVERLTVLVDGEPFTAAGEAVGGADGVRLNATVRAERIDLNRWQEILARKSKDGKEAGPAAALPVTGTVQVAADTVLYDTYRFEAVGAAVGLYPDRTEVAVQKGRICGVSVPGEITFFPDSIALAVRPSAAGGQMAESARCFSGEKAQIDGRFSVNGSLAGRGRAEELVSSLSGTLNYSAQEGQIRSGAGFGVLKQVLALVNVTEIFAGALPDFSRSGFRYNAIQARAEIENGVAHLTEVVVDGRNMKLTAQGELSLVDKRLNLTVLVAPLKTVDRIVGKIPLVSDILAGTLVSIPVKVRGTLENPKTDFMPPSMVGKRLIGITERTLKLPFRLVQPKTP